MNELLYHSNLLTSKSIKWHQNKFIFTVLTKRFSLFNVWCDSSSVCLWGNLSLRKYCFAGFYSIFTGFLIHALYWTIHINLKVFMFLWSILKCNLDTLWREDAWWLFFPIILSVFNWRASSKTHIKWVPALVSSRECPYPPLQGYRYSLGNHKDIYIYLLESGCFIHLSCWGSWPLAWSVVVVYVGLRYCQS